MQTIDFICLWTGYVICALALLRHLVDGVFATYRTYRRAVRWMARRVGPAVDAVAVAQDRNLKP